MRNRALNTSPYRFQKTSLPDWSGFTVVCIASGPSLLMADVEAVRKWRGSSRNRSVVVTNTTHKAAPWADVLYAMDTKWWRFEGPNDKNFQGLKITGKRRTTSNCPIAERIDFDQGGNSGDGAIRLAAFMGAKDIILLGYDAKYDQNGKRHWHGDHPLRLGNCESVGKFYGHFKKTASDLKGVRIVNASRKTALDMFPIVDLLDELA